MLQNDLVSYSYLGFLTGLKIDDIRYILNGKHVINKTFDDIIFLIANENYMLPYFFSNKSVVIDKLEREIKNKDSLFFGRLDIIYEIKHTIRANDLLNILQRMTTKEFKYFISFYFVTFDFFLNAYTEVQNKLTDERTFLNPWEYREVLKKEFWVLINEY